MRKTLCFTMASFLVLAAAGLQWQACCGKGGEKKDEGPAKAEGEKAKEGEELMSALKNLGEAAKKAGDLPPTDPAEAKLAIDEPSIKIVRTKYSTMVYCYVKNDGKQANSATIKATFKDASGAVLATATGSANDIIPGRKKPVELYSSEKVGEDAQVKVEIDLVHGYAKTGEDDITTGNITVKKQYGMPKVTGEATNKGTEAHSFTPYAVLLDKDGGILGMAYCEAVNELAPGGTKAFSCTSSAKLKSWDTVEVGVGTMIK